MLLSSSHLGWLACRVTANHISLITSRSIRRRLDLVSTRPGDPLVSPPSPSLGFVLYSSPRCLSHFFLREILQAALFLAESPLLQARWISLLPMPEPSVV
ncbi:hypothetical protein DPEC_G00112300 [Dallia pectoralis]|uniref:Uncharacterized protein n=1 Tax=Dallia pectoralis TaxID=75939 RepID=A0ACC2GT53_DALPE|nr:hypothetical protein DPEC_G00112300 [Dallia pectoralis]